MVDKELDLKIETKVSSGGKFSPVDNSKIYKCRKLNERNSSCFIYFDRAYDSIAFQIYLINRDSTANTTFRVHPIIHSVSFHDHHH
jgi:hypothetical protein